MFKPLNIKRFLPFLLSAKRVLSNNLSNTRKLCALTTHNLHTSKILVSELQIICKLQYPTVISVRNYAKSKDKKKEKGKGKVQINEAQMSELINVENFKTQMQKALENLKEDFVKNLSLRSTSGSIESLIVNVDGEEHSLQELAQIVRKNPKLVVVNMADFPQVIPAALKAIAKSGMNLNPQQEGTTLYIPVPKYILILSFIFPWRIDYFISFSFAIY